MQALTARGFLGAALNEHLTRYNHQVFILAHHRNASQNLVSNSNSETWKMH
jgi:NAD dependent epimerase/dehydratase family enzyme